MNRFCISVLFLFSGLFSYAQQEEIFISEQFEGATLKQVFTTLTDQYALRVVYSDNLIQGVSVSLILDQLPLEDAIREILEGTGLTFEILRPSTILITQRARTDKKIEKSVFGSVMDAQSGERLPFVYFYQPLEALSTNSNEDGYFTLSRLSPGSTVKVSYIGYRDTTIHAADLWNDERIALQLSPSLLKLDEVFVHNTQPQAFTSTANLFSIALSPAFAKSIPASGESDIFRIMQLLPGVAGTNELSSGLAVNGGTATQNLVLFDGIPIYHVDHFFGYYSAINPNAVKSINLYKGGFEAKYGGRSSSVVNIVGNDGNGEEVSGQISFNELSANTSLAVPISEKSRIFLAARRSYTDVLETSLFESIFTLFESDLRSNVNQVRVFNQSYTPEFYYTDLSLKFSTELTKNDMLEVSFYDSHDILNFTEEYDVLLTRDTVLNIRKIGFINWGNIGASAKYSKFWNQDHYTNVLLSFSSYQSEYKQTSTTKSTDSGANRTTAQDNMIRDISVKVDHEWRIGSRKLETGLQLSSYQTSINNVVDDNVITDIDQNRILHLIQYIQYPLVKNGTLEVVAGLRNNYLSSTRQVYSEPRINLTWRLTDNIFVHGATGIYRQFVNQIQTENVLQGSRDIWLISDEKIADQRSNHLILGLEYLKNGVNISANYFSKTFDGLLDYAFRAGGLVTQFENYEQLFFQGESVAKGLEVLVKKESNLFTAWASYTLSDSRTRYPDLRADGYFPSDNDQRHELTLFASRKMNKFTLFGTWYFGSGMPYTEFNVRGFQNNNNRRVTVIRADQQNNARLPAYHRLDLGLTYSLRFQSSELQLSGKVFNLYNQKNILDQRVEVIVPPQRPNAQRTPRPRLVPYDIQLMGITPSFGVNFKF